MVASSGSILTLIATLFLKHRWNVSCHIWCYCPIRHTLLLYWKLFSSHVALVVLSAHNVGMPLSVFWVLGYCPPSGFYWSGFIGQSYSGISRDTLLMETGTTEYWSGRLPHAPVEDVLYGWLVVDPRQSLAPSHAIICSWTSWTRPLNPTHGLVMVCAAVDAPGKWPPVLFSSKFNPPLTSPWELPLAGRSWSWIFQHWP